MESPERKLGFLEEYRFGYFQLQPRRRKTARRQRGDHHLGQMIVSELNRGHFDCTSHPLPPKRSVAARLTHDPFADRHDQPDLFGNGDEFARPDYSPLRMAPTDERFRSAHSACVQVDLWLI